ncbi:MAG: response regulator transcription factor [Oscillospiraceae bacterium]|nr:response regulator transcription factor [Oscillospiraceae bacterium]
MPLYLSSNGLTAMQYRPNIIFTDCRRNKDSDIQRLLLKDEINVAESDSDVTATKGAHLMIIRDEGIALPGFAVLEKVRSVSNIPVLMLPDSTDEIYNIMALSKGADMVCDPKCVYEMKARVTALIRRSTGALERPRTLSNGAISVDMRSRTVYSEGSRISMTAIEYGIVQYLLENLGTPCSIDEIYTGVWHEKPYRVRKTIVEHIRRIRAKIEPDPHNPSYIKAVSGIGYKMEYAY